MLIWCSTHNVFISTAITDGPERKVWLIGTRHLAALESFLHRAGNLDLGLESRGFNLLWHCRKDTQATDVMDIMRKMKRSEQSDPDLLFLHIGGVEITDKIEQDFKYRVQELIDTIASEFPGTKLAWIQLLPEKLPDKLNLAKLNKQRNFVDDHLAVYALSKGASYVRLQHDLRDKRMFKVTKNEIKILPHAIDLLKSVLKGGVLSILDRGILIHPDMTLLPKQCHMFVGKNRELFQKIRKVNKRPWTAKK